MIAWSISKRQISPATCSLGVQSMTCVFHYIALPQKRLSHFLRLSPPLKGDAFLSCSIQAFAPDRERYDDLLIPGSFIDTSRCS